MIAHEIGHHMQNLLGLLPKVLRAQSGKDQADANAQQVRVELQADCLAGVWLNRVRRSGNSSNLAMLSLCCRRLRPLEMLLAAGLKSGEVARRDTFRAPEL